MNPVERPNRQADAMVILPSQRQSAEALDALPSGVHADAPLLRADDEPPTKYLPSIGKLPHVVPSAGPVDAAEERAAALRAALQGERPIDEYLSLLDRVLRGLRRL